MKSLNDSEDFLKMKKIIVFIYALALTAAAPGQQVADNIMKARALCSAEKPEQAVKVLTDAIGLEKDSRLYLERAFARKQLRDFSGAIGDLNEANNLSPESGEFGLAEIYALKGDAATSLYHLELSMNSPSRRSEKEIMLDPAFSSLGNKPEWKLFWKKEWYTPPERSISEIEYYVSAGMVEDSKEELSSLAKNYPGSDEAVYGEALVNMAAGKYGEAISALTGLLADKPGNDKYLRLLAKAQTLSGNAAGASVTYTRLLDSGIADAEIILQRAECYRKTGETDKSLRDIERYLGYYPDSKAALSLAGKVEAASGDNLKALDYFSRNVKLNPGDPECYTDRANSYFISKSWEWAARDYSMSLDLNPANAEAWLNKGIALLNTGRVEEACHDFRKSLSLGNKRATEYISTNCIK
jgi:tetratricopeptide (TPR) repeat protein